MKIRGWLFVVVMGLSGCASNSPHHGVVRGTATYDGPLELSPDAVFEAVLEDVSLADVAATRVSSNRLDPAGSPPFRFEIIYDRKIIDPRHRYAVRARVTDGDRTILTSDTVYPVLTDGAGDSVKIALRRVVSASEGNPADASP